MQAIEDGFQLVQVLPMHELFDQRLLFLDRRLLALYQRFDAMLLFQQLLHTRQRALRSFRVVRLRGVPRFAFELLFVHVNGACVPACAVRRRTDCRRQIQPITEPARQS